MQTVPEERRWGYREKVCLATVWTADRWRFGMIRRDELIAIPRCPVHAERTRQVIKALSAVLPPVSVFPLAFYVQAGAQATLVLKTHGIGFANRLGEDLQPRVAAAGLEGLWLHFNPAAGRRLFIKSGWQLIWGVPRSLDATGLWYGPASFQQVLPELFTAALTAAEAFLAPTAAAVVVDLYCGIGASLVRWMRHGARSVGVELNGEAVECAGRNAAPAQVLRGKCAQRIPQLQSWLESNPQARDRCLLYVNPPRTGIEPEVREWIATACRPERLAYLSCSAGTLSRDLKIFSDSGYHVERITPYDFFPQTHHVETLALLRRGG